MSLDWKTVELKSIADVTMGQSPKSEFYNDNFEGMPFLQGNKTFGDKYPSFELYTTSIKKVAKKSSVLMSVRAPVGDLNIAKEDICIGRGVCGLQMKKGNNEFLYYLLKANISHLINKESGTVFGSINKNDIETFEVTLPEDSEDQMKILTILKNIDKKIEVCRNLNKNLQKQINILFKSFFINFEFYDGKYQETLFGEIPIEWNIILFKDILNERNEKSTNQDISMYSVTLDGIQPRADIYKKKITAKTTKFKIIHKYDLIFGMPNSGYQYGIMYDEIGGVSSAYPVFEINGIQPRYVDLFIKNISNYFNDIVKSGSRMGQGIDKKVLLSKEIYVPPNEHLDKYYSIESKLLDLINHNLTEINNLTKLRDTLLPKLMSGEIDVSKINCDLKIIIRKIYIKSSKLFLWRYLSENQNYIKNTKSNETLLKSRTIHKINKFLAKFNARYRYYRQ